MSKFIILAVFVVISVDSLCRACIVSRFMTSKISFVLHGLYDMDHNFGQAHH